MQLLSVSFLLAFAALVAVYYLLPARFRWAALLCFSWGFVALSDARYLVPLLAVTVCTYSTALRMDQRTRAAVPEDAPRAERKRLREQTKRRNRVTLVICLLLCAALLFFCKAMLITEDTGGALSFLHSALPLGLSFYLFQTVAYCIDVYRGKRQAVRHFGHWALFAAYFPYLTQGPISTGELAQDLTQNRPFDGKNLAFGAQRMLWGFFKKLVIADRIAPLVSALRDESLGGTGFFLLTLAYAVQIYGDFTGGIDIAIGMSECLGIPLCENFERPFFSKNIAEYWRRWHISLGEWMKNYIFYPLCVSKPMLRFGKAARARLGNFGKRLPVYIASIVTWAATGIWHGLTPNFLVWGMLNCFVIVVSEELAPLYERFHKRFAWSNGRGYDAFQMVRMFLLMNFIRVCDLFPNVGQYFAGFARLFTAPNFAMLMDGTLLQLGLTGLDYGILALGCALCFAVSVLQTRVGSVREALARRSDMTRWALNFALLLAVLLLGSYGSGYNASSFIYNQF